MTAVQNEEGLQAAGPKTRSAKTPKEDSWLLDLTQWSLWEEETVFYEFRKTQIATEANNCAQL